MCRKFSLIDWPILWCTKSPILSTLASPSGEQKTTIWHTSPSNSFTCLFFSRSPEWNSFCLGKIILYSGSQVICVSVAFRDSFSRNENGLSVYESVTGHQYCSLKFTLQDWKISGEREWREDEVWSPTCGTKEQGSSIEMWNFNRYRSSYSFQVSSLI